MPRVDSGPSAPGPLLSLSSSRSTAAAAAAAASSPKSKVRKIRKGTRSCWECKRRKNRCTWSTTTTTADEGKCDGCFHRGTRCVGQEFPDEHAPFRKRGVNGSKSNNSTGGGGGGGGGGNKADESKIRRLEALVEELSRKVNSGKSRADDAVPLPSSDRGDDDDGPDVDVLMSPHVAEPSEPLVLNEVVVDLDLQNARTREASVPQSPLSRILSGVVNNNNNNNDNNSSPGRALGMGMGMGIGITNDESIASPLFRALVAAWPSKHHQDAIVNSEVGSLHPALSSACSGFRSPPSPKDMVRLPSPGTTPVAIARRLLILGTHLQVISSQSEHRTVGLGPSYHVVASRMLETVSKLVTHNDSLPESVDIIQCLIIESQYHNYMGNVRRAWIVLRRAMAMAQMLGLDRQTKTITHNGNTDETQVISPSEKIWFLLVHYDQYLSLVLGISPNLPEHSQRTARLLQKCTPSQRMGRLHSMAAGRILQRNRVDMYDTAETNKIDKILQEAAGCMPAQWWLPPDWTDHRDNEKVFIDRLMVHFAHHNILLQVHIPYMLRSLGGQEQYYYSTSAVVDCSREILVRFTTFRTRYPSVSYCRGLDIFAFVACIALCLLHIRSNRESQGVTGCNDASIYGLPTHQRPVHRGLMEKALQNIQKLAQIEKDDKITHGIAPLFQKLLQIEEEAHRGVDYSIRLPSDTEQPIADGSEALSLEVPFCGTIKIIRDNPLDYIPTCPPSSLIDMMKMTYMPMDIFPPSLAGCTTPDGQDSLVSEGHGVENTESNNTNTDNCMPTPYPSDSRSMPYEVPGLISTPGLPVSEALGGFEERRDFAGFFERIWDVE